jgi:hypothetical protein
VKRDFSTLDLDPRFHRHTFFLDSEHLKLSTYWKGARRAWFNLVNQYRAGGKQPDDDSLSSQSDPSSKKARATSKGAKKRPRKKNKIDNDIESFDSKSITELTGSGGGDLIELCHRYSPQLSPVKEGMLII